MDMFWKSQGPLTIHDVQDWEGDHSWRRRRFMNEVLLSLEAKNMIRDCGFELRSGAPSVRVYEARMTREEYVAKIIASKGYGVDFMVNLAEAMAGELGEEKQTVLKKVKEAIEKVNKD